LLISKPEMDVSSLALNVDNTNSDGMNNTSSTVMGSLA